jgi:hypothetical protein
MQPSTQGKASLSGVEKPQKQSWLALLAEGVVCETEDYTERDAIRLELFT